MHLEISNVSELQIVIEISSNVISEIFKKISIFYHVTCHRLSWTHFVYYNVHCVKHHTFVNKHHTFASIYSLACTVLSTWVFLHRQLSIYYFLCFFNISHLFSNAWMNCCRLRLLVTCLFAVIYRYHTRYLQSYIAITLDEKDRRQATNSERWKKRNKRECA